MAAAEPTPKLTREAVLAAVGSIRGGRITGDVLARLNRAGYYPTRPALWVMLGKMRQDGELESRRVGRVAYWRAAGS